MTGVNRHCEYMGLLESVQVDVVPRIAQIINSLQGRQHLCHRQALALLLVIYSCGITLKSWY